MTIEKRLILLCAFQSIALGIAAWLGFDALTVIRHQQDRIERQEREIEWLNRWPRERGP